MSFDLSDDELERQLGTMLRERGATVSERVAVDRVVIRRARRRRTTKLASLGSGLALGIATVVVITVSLTGSPRGSTRNEPASHGSGGQLTAPPPPATIAPPQPGWSTLPAAPISARAASATAIAGNAFVVWGGEGAHGERLTDGAWMDVATGAWHRMSPSPLPPPSYPSGKHFVAAQAIGDAVVIVSDGAVARYWPSLDRWQRLVNVPLARINNMALLDASSTPAIALTGVNSLGAPAYAFVRYDAMKLWVTGPLTGRSVGRPAVRGDQLGVLVRNGRRLELDTVNVVAGGSPAYLDVTDELPANFVPRIWMSTTMIGGDEGAEPSTTITVFNPVTRRVDRTAHAYDTSASVHTWTGTYAVSWSDLSCAGSQTSAVAYDPRRHVVVSVPQAPISFRRAPDFTVGPDGRLFVWGGIDVHGRYLADGAVLTLP